jgi:hypothetical protein
MSAKPKEYRRLPGRGIKRQGFLAGSFTARRARLWLGQDHLLSVESQWYTEEYRRFYFRDIQAIIIRKTLTGRIINIVLGVLALLNLLGAFASTDGLRVFWSVIMGVFAFFLLLNTLAGPTSACHLRTAVQTEELASLRRVRRARKVLARVRPLIAEAQGELTPEEIAGRTEPVAGSAFSAPAAPPGAAPPVIPPA